MVMIIGDGGNPGFSRSLNAEELAFSGVGPNTCDLKHEPACGSDSVVQYPVDLEGMETEDAAGIIGHQRVTQYGRAQSKRAFGRLAPVPLPEDSGDRKIRSRMDVINHCMSTRRDDFRSTIE